jgi:acyl-CoA thioester hydrolase
MSEFRYYQPIEVRYADLDPQGHVNNAKYLTYLEQGRVGYIQHLGLWQGGSFQEFGVILADAQITFRAPIYYGQDVRVGVRVSSFGNKSMKMDYILESREGGKQFATASTVLVAYDYHTAKTIPVPANWRTTIAAFEAST